MELDRDMDDVNKKIEEERMQYACTREEFGKVLREISEVEAEKRKISGENLKRERRDIDEIERLKREIEEAEKEIAEVKADKQDIMGHIAMSLKIKKSKNQKEISQGQTLIFETGPAKKGSRR